jgi:two-component system OmpR family sensor kinase
MEPEDWQRPFEVVDLSALMKSVAAEHASAALNRQIDLGVSHDESPLIRGDSESLRVMLGNLVDNALRYTPKGGQVDLALKMANGFAQLEVLDTGRGIPVSERVQVFSRFYRLPGNREMGSGLGLAIVQEVVVHHHGKVRMEDGANGIGLKVIVRLPIYRDGVREKGWNSSGCS